MKSKYLFVPLAVLLVGGGCIQSDYNKNQVVQPTIVEKYVEVPAAQSQPLSYILGPIIFDIPQGLGVWQSRHDQGFGVNILPKELHNKLKDPRFESEVPPPFISINVFLNDKKLSSEAWVKSYPDNYGYSNKTLFKKVIIGGQEGIEFDIESLHNPKTQILQSPDKSYIIEISKNYSDIQDTDDTKLLQKVLDTIKLK